MKKLLTLDSENYQDCTKLLEKWSARGIIYRGNELAMQQDAHGLYKIPGGTVEQGESFIEALLREVTEETGLLVIEDSIKEIGEIVEIRKDIFDPSTKYVCHTLYYLCNVKAETVPLSMTKSEIERGFHLSWATPEEIYKTNTTTVPYDFSHPNKDMCLIKMLLDSQISGVEFA